MEIYDIAVVGAGAAGSLAAIRASQLAAHVIVIERNGAIGKKILLTARPSSRNAKYNLFFRL